MSDYDNIDFNAISNLFAQGNSMLQNGSPMGALSSALNQGGTPMDSLRTAMNFNPDSAGFTRNPVSFKSSFNNGGATPANNGFSFENMFGENGWGGTALQSIMGLGSLLNANKALGMQERTMNTNIDALKTNLANQSKLTNNRLRQQQEEINKYNPDQAQDIDQYMKKWGVSGELGKTNNTNTNG